jgi:DHA1 family bicyclomycin/chloramphenicol resistance-like MFS transporter
LLIESFGWRSVFWSVTAIAVVDLVILFTSMEETRPAAQREGSSVASALKAYGELMRDRHFLGLVFIGAFGMASFFSFLANSPFVMIDHYGLTPRQYSMAFAVNAASFIGVSQFTGKLAAKFGLIKLVKFAVTGYAAVMTGLLLQNILGVDRLDVLIVMMLMGFGFLGLVVPTASVLALEAHGAIAGTASALMGTLQFLTGAIVMAVVGQFVDGSARPMVAGIALCAMASLAMVRLTLRAHQSD